ncbi:unnamed protein product, partial [Oncorhynchus mykiss]
MYLGLSSEKPRMFQVTLDESNRTWGRSTIYKPEEFDDVKKGIKKKGRTWGPSSVQTKERGSCAERVRPLSDGNNPWSTSLGKSVPLAALFAEQQGTSKEEMCSPDGSENTKPKQLKFPNQVYIDLPLWKDEKQQGGEGTAGSCPGESLEDSSTTSASSTSTTPQHTPTNSLKRTSARRRTDAVLYGCASMLASVALGFDLRNVLNAPPADDPEPQPSVEKKKKEGLFQRATRFPGGRSSHKEEAASQGPINLISMSSISEYNSTKSLLRSASEGPEPSPVKEVAPISLSHPTPQPRSGSQSQVPEAPGRRTPASPLPQPAAPEKTHSQSMGSHLRRKKSAIVQDSHYDKEHILIVYGFM